MSEESQEMSAVELTDQQQPTRTMAATAVRMTEIVMPNDSNPHGTVSGGRVMHLIDICGTVAAVRHARRQVVTASIDEVAFVAPVPLGHILILDGMVTCAGSTSMEVRVIVRGENPITGDVRQTTTAYLTFVALAEDGQPTAVPELVAETDEQHELMRHAKRRRQARLARFDSP